MATINVSPGLNTIQTGINAANNTGAGTVDEVVLAAGTYTFNTIAMILDSVVTGTLFAPGTVGNPSVIIRGVDRDTVILDFAGCTGNAIHCGNAQGVMIRDMTWKGGVSTNASFAYLRDHADSGYVGWTFDNIKIDSPTVTPHTRPPFQIATNPPGAGLSIKNIVTTANFAGSSLITIYGTTSNLDLYIKGIDARLHSGSIEKAIELRDVRDVRVRDVQINATTSTPFDILSADNTKGVYDVYVNNVTITNAPAAAALHVGNRDASPNDPLKLTKRVYLHGITVTDGLSYGIEFENWCSDCELVNFRTTRTVEIGVALAEDCSNILVCDGTIDTVTSATSSAMGIAVVHDARHRILRNTICNVKYGIQLTEAGVFTTENERNTIKDNIMYNVDYAYRAQAIALPNTAAGSSMIGPNTIFTPNTGFAFVDDVAKTQAEWAALFPASIDEPDVIVTGLELSTMKYSTQQALNILAGNMDAPYVKYSSQQAANMLVGNTAGNMNKFSAQQALNIAVSS